MTARILVVDDILANVKLLEARLTAEYFEVLTAMNGQDALDICENERADVVLLDVMMPGMDGFEVCRRLKSNPKTQQLPVIMVTALDQPSDKVHGLEAGADDFLTKPVDEIALMTRVRNLARVKMLNDEMMMRAATGGRLEMADDDADQWQDIPDGGKILLVDDHQRSADRMVNSLAPHFECAVEADPQSALVMLTRNPCDLLMVSLSLEDADGLRLCSQIRSLDKTRHLPILMLIEPGDDARLLRGLDIGVNDYIVRPIDRSEMLARVRTQIKRKRYADCLRQRLEERVEQALIDPLTGLHNRRYLQSHMRGQIDEAIKREKPLSMLLLDIDYFKSVNDTFGHDAGDAVLREFAIRLRRNIRGIDLVARPGGEEFVVVMPDTNARQAYYVAERLRRAIEVENFRVSDDGKDINVTASVGIASLETQDDTAESILKRADEALYTAKRGGRNRVAAEAA